MVATRKSLSASTSNAAPPSAADALSDLAAHDGREARRLQTNALFEAERPAPSARGTYIWKGGQSYDILGVPGEEKWIAEGQEWLRKMEANKEARRRRSEFLAAANAKNKVGADKKRKIEETKTKPSAPASAPSSATTRRRSAPGGSSRLAAPTPFHESDGSNIDVTGPRKAKTSRSGEAARAPTVPEEDVKEDSPLSELGPSESDTSDIPRVKQTRTPKRMPTKTKTKTTKKKTTKTKTPKTKTPQEIGEAIEDDLRLLGKTNDRLNALKSWWDRQKQIGAFEQLVQIGRKNKQGKVLDDDEWQRAREFSESVSSNDSVGGMLATIAKDLEAEEKEEQEKQRNAMLFQDDQDDEDFTADAAADESMPTPVSEDPPPPAPPAAATAVPTPPASDNSNDHDEAMPDAHARAPTPPASDNLSPRVLISPQNPLPPTDAAGNTLRWSLDLQKLNNIKLKTKEMHDPNRAEHAIHFKRLEGESTSQRRRRVKREQKVLSGWTIIPDPNQPAADETIEDQMEDLDMQDVQADEETAQPVPVLQKVGRIGRGATRRRRSQKIT